MTCRAFAPLHPVGLQTAINSESTAPAKAASTARCAAAREPTGRCSTSRAALTRSEVERTDRTNGREEWRWTNAHIAPIGRYDRCGSQSGSGRQRGDLRLIAHGIASKERKAILINDNRSRHIAVAMR